MDLTWLLDLISLPPQIQGILEQSFLGNSVLQYGLFACVILVAWVLAFLASFTTRKLLGRVLRRFGETATEKVVFAVRRPIRVLTFMALTFVGTSLLTQEPTTSDQYAHWVYVVLWSGANIGTRLCAFWVGARLLALGWYEYLSPLIDRKIEGEEKRFFPVAYKLVATSLWVVAIANCTPVLGYDALELLLTILAAEALHNTIGQYLAFLGLVLLTLLLARTIFNFVHAQMVSFAMQRAEKLKLGEDTFESFQRPLLYLVTLIGFRLSTTVLTNGDNVDLHDVAAVAIDICIVVDVVWITFILVDKLYEQFVLPLASKGPGGVDEQLIILTRKIAKVCLGVVGGIFLIKATGKDPVAILAGLGIGGVAIGFAAKDTLSPFMGGIAIYLTHPYRIGDYIGVEGGLEGQVVDIGLRATMLRTKWGTTFIVPNDKIINHAIHNTGKDGRAYDGLFLRIDIATVPDKRDEAIALFKQAVLDTDGAHEPTIHFLEYGSDNLGLKLSYWIDDTSKFWDIRHGIMMLIDTNLRAIGVEMSLPTSALAFHGYLPDGDAPTINIGTAAARPPAAAPFPNVAPPKIPGNPPERA